MKLQIRNRKCILRFAMENLMLKGSIKESPVDGKRQTLVIYCSLSFATTRSFSWRLPYLRQYALPKRVLP